MIEFSSAMDTFGQFASSSIVPVGKPRKRWVTCVREQLQQRKIRTAEATPRGSPQLRFPARQFKTSSSNRRKRMDSNFPCAELPAIFCTFYT